MNKKGEVINQSEAGELNEIIGYEFNGSVGTIYTTKGAIYLDWIFLNNIIDNEGDIVGKGISYENDNICIFNRVI